ncbi:MAG: TraR/DksA C4-type zinc finger protein [Actinomycetota bacterium]
MTADVAVISSRTAAPRNPATQGRHLHPAALPQWRALLGSRWQERLERVTELSLAYYRAEEDAADPGRSPSARRDARREAAQIRRRTVSQRRDLAEIEAALSRLATGRFGWCEQCGMGIGAARLTAGPAGRYCAACDS